MAGGGRDTGVRPTRRAGAGQLRVGDVQRERRRPGERGGRRATRQLGPSRRYSRSGGKVRVETAKTSISIEYPITHLGLGDVEDTQFTDRSVHAGETGTTMRIIVT